MPRPPAKMYRREFEERAGIGKSRYFDLLADPAIAEELEAGVDEQGRFVNRRKALAFIAVLVARRQAARQRVALNLGDYITRPCPHEGCDAQITRRTRTCPTCSRRVPAPVEPPRPRGRPCPACGRRITRKPTICRHCGEDV